MGLSLPRLLAAEAAAQSLGDPKPRADSCVLIFLNGGPSHLDMWDMKPDAPDGIRGEFKPISTSVPGMQFGEHLPKLARHAHRATIVRSMHHSVNNAHAAAVYASLTGHDRGDNTPAIGGGSREYPAIGSVLGMLRPPQEADRAARLPALHHQGRGRRSAAARLLRRHAGPGVRSAVRAQGSQRPDFAVPELTLLADVSVERLSARQALFRADRRAFRARSGPFGLRRHGRLPPPGAESVDFRRDAAGAADRRRAGQGARKLRPQHLRPERAAGPAADRGRHADGHDLLGARRQRHLGHARHQLQEAEKHVAAAVRRRVQQPDRRPGPARTARPHAGGRDGRFRPLAEDQRQRRRPRPLELLLQPDADRRRHQGRLRLRRQRQDRRLSGPRSVGAG